MSQILILIFAEVLGLYGLIVALILNTNSSTDYTVSIWTVPACGRIAALTCSAPSLSNQLVLELYYIVPFPIINPILPAP